jgi:putative transposase
MQRIFNPLLLLLLTGSTKDLINQIQYLKIENGILRSKLPKIVPVTDVEKRRLIRYGKKLGAALKWLITIVTYRTF